VGVGCEGARTVACEGGHNAVLLFVGVHCAGGLEVFGERRVRVNGSTCADVSSGWLIIDQRRLTLLLCLILLLVLRKQHVVGQTSSRYSPLKTHGVTFTRQAPGAETAVW
jgi:hypothetical protein